jgi:hypothetical protein
MGWQTHENEEHDQAADVNSFSHLLLCQHEGSTGVLSRSGAAHEVQYQRDHREHQQNVNQSAGDVKDPKSQKPSYQQNHKENRKDAHLPSLKYRNHLATG